MSVGRPLLCMFDGLYMFTESGNLSGDYAVWASLWLCDVYRDVLCLETLVFVLFQVARFIEVTIV